MALKNWSWSSDAILESHRPFEDVIYARDASAEPYRRTDEPDPSFSSTNRVFSSTHSTES